ncbi:unnamed protein product [Prorocentrum cordatum]|uniref:Carbamoyl-phosphate synthase small subunit N-terminal domain-containing protein n=1 Tax=Prorocentrum cordatum TaxID=2364126 RepID=A0ABN9UV47_9DINO|nr:unnamed protein product [Polarella glacialis]
MLSRDPAPAGDREPNARPESLTDPSYAGQILVLTFPLVGNYGVPDEDPECDALGLLRHFESNKIHIKALVISDYSFVASHYTSRKTLGQWLEEHKIPGIYGVDTRALTKLIRMHGALLGKVVVEGGAQSASMEFADPNETNLAASVSRTQKQVFLPPPLPPAVEDGAAAPTPAEDEQVKLPAKAYDQLHTVKGEAGLEGPKADLNLDQGIAREPTQTADTAAGDVLAVVSISVFVSTPQRDAQSFFQDTLAAQASEIETPRRSSPS